MKKIVPCLWYDSEAEEAVKLYVSIFPNSRITQVDKYPEGGEGVTGKPTGSVMTVSFELDGNKFMALNGGPDFKFTEAVSFIYSCDGQEQVDELWNKLIADGGEESMCGWLKDKYGLSWQIVPKQLDEMITDPDPERAKRAMQAMLKMRKIDLAELEKAVNG